MDRSNVRAMAEQTRLDAITNRTQRFKVSLTPAQVGANSQGTETVTDVYCSSDDDVTVQYPSQTDGMIVSARVSDKNEVTVVFENTTGGAITPTAGTYYLRINRG